VIATGEFSGSDFRVGRVIGKPTVHFGYPALDQEGKIQSVTFAALYLSWLQTLAAGLVLPERSTLTVVDQQGTILVRYPDHENWVGRKLTNTLVLETASAQEEGVAQEIGMDGIERVYAVKRIGGAGSGGFVYVGLPAKQVFGEAEQMLRRNMVSFGLATIVAMVGAWGLSHVFIMRPTRILTDTSTKLAEGDLSARTGLTPKDGEMGDLGMAFDRMGEALQQRSALHDKALKAVELLKRQQQLILDSAWEGIFGLDLNGNHTFVNPSAARMLGYEVGELLGRHSHSTWHHSKPDGSSYPDEDCLIYATLKDGKAHHIRDDIFWRKDGSSFLADCTSAPIVDKGEVIGAVVSFLDVTEPRKARRELEETRERFELALKGADLGSFDWYVQSGAAVANRRAAEIVGYSLDEIDQSFSFWESLLHPDDRARALEKVEAHLWGRSDFYEDEYRLRAKSGEWKWVLSRGKVVERNEDGLPLRMTGTFMDITDRKNAEQASKESQELYRAVFNNAGFGIGIVGKDWRFEEANPILREMFGYTEEELQELSAQDLTHPDDRGDSRQLLEALASEQIDSYRIEKRYVTKSGSIMWGDLSVSAIRDAKGNYRAMLGMIADITEPKRAELELKKSEERLRMIIDSSPIGIRIVLEGRYVYVNPAFVKIFGYARAEDILGLPVEALFAPQHRELVRQGVGSASVGTGRYYEASGIKKNGQAVEIAAWGILIDYEERPARLGFLVDITESKSLRAQLVQAQKMEAIGTLAGGIAHDFNNLLTVILGYAEFLLSDGSCGAHDREDLDKIRIAAGRGADLVQRLLTFSRKTETRPVPLNLNDEIEQVSKLLARTLPKMITIELGLSDDLAIVNADPTQIEQVIMNLAVNAKDAMPDGGKIVIETRNIGLDETYCAIHLEAKPGPSVVLSVSDTGYGMDQECMEHIFEPFYTTKVSGKGTGLGLAVVYGIVHQHGGHIRCYSEPGQGTTFRIYLPALRMTGAEKPASQDVPEPRGGSETVLLVDDEKFVRELGQRILQRAGYRVLTATNGKEALGMYGEQQGRISLVILDLIMPEMDGNKCLETLLKIDPKARVLLSSGYASGGTRKLADELGARGFVGKPYIAKRFLQAVRDILDS